MRENWDEAVDVTDTEGWHALEVDGLDAAIGWYVPNGLLGKRPADDSARQIRGYAELPDGGRRPFVRPFTKEDRESLENDVAWYLEEAGIPARPVGYDWFIKGPTPGRYTSPVTLIEDAVIKRGGSDPSRIREDLEAVIPGIYDTHGHADS